LVSSPDASTARLPTPFELALPVRAGVPAAERRVRGRVHWPDPGLHPSPGPQLDPNPGTAPWPHVFLVHGYLAFMDWGFLPALARALTANGLAVVQFNLSGSGVGPELDRFSDPIAFAHNTYEQELEDLWAVAESLRRGQLGALDPERGGLFGHSRGAAMAVLHADRWRAAGHRPYRALCTWSAVAEVGRYDPERLVEWRQRGFLWVQLEPDLLRDFEGRPDRLDVRAAAGRLDVPLLLVHGDRDRSVLPEEAQELARCSPPGRAELLRVPGAGHNFGAHRAGTAGGAPLDVALRATCAHFRRHLLGAAEPGTADLAPRT
jgi:pimeloyl-ACP methyl ester carboxylesterase